MVRIESEEGETNGVRSVDIAQRLGVSKASVNKAVSALKASELVEQSHYGKVVLTDRTPLVSPSSLSMRTMHSK